MAEHTEVILRTILAFSMLLTAARFLGKQTLSKMTYFDFIGSITIGAIIANLSFNVSIKVHHFVLSFILFVLVIFLSAFLSMKSNKIRKFLAGDPTVVIQNGKILEHNMKKMRYTLDYLNQQLREKDVFNMEEVLYAIVEINGTLTVLKKPQYRSITKQDLWIPTQPEPKLPIELVMDGQLINKNLEQNKLTQPWLESELAKRNLQINEVVYAVLAVNGNLYIDTYRDHIQSPIDLEPN